MAADELASRRYLTFSLLQGGVCGSGRADTRNNRVSRCDRNPVGARLPARGHQPARFGRAADRYCSPFRTWGRRKLPGVPV